jgi:hypothetical protein
MEGYTTEEVVECCMDYVKDRKRIGLPIPLHEGRLRGRRRMCQKSFVDRDYNSESEAHSLYYNNSRLLHRISRNTCRSFIEIT